MKIYPGGIAGSEDDMIRKMKVGTLGGAVLTNIGLTKINPDAFVLSTPFMFHSEKEMAYVMERLNPVFEKQIKEKGFKVIIWTMSGWVNFFSKNPGPLSAGPEKAKVVIHHRRTGNGAGLEKIGLPHRAH